MNFKIGDKVICLAAFRGECPWLDSGDPVKGSVYTVRRAFVGSHGFMQIPCVYLEGVAGSKNWLGYEIGFDSKCFMLVSDFEASIEPAAPYLEEAKQLINMY